MTRQAPQDWFGATLTPLAGGYSGETFLVGDDPADQVVLRIYRRHPDRALVDAALMHLMRGILPVAEVIEARPATSQAPAVVVTRKIKGVGLDVVLRDDPAALDRSRLGREIGRILARLSGVPFPHPGMLEGRGLTLSSAALPDDLTAFAQHFRDTGRLAAWAESDFDALLGLIDLAEDLSASVDVGNGGRTVLVHSDFNPKNLLVDAETFRVTGVMDWEFAYAGSPYADLGNLTRFERCPDLLDAVVDTFVERAPALALEPLDLARAADVWALVELAGGVPLNAVRELATELLLAQARAHDLHAWPWDAPRVDPHGAGPVS
jgi:aminoglycoside phosphotransferase (APT) family kinase protein